MRRRTFLSTTLAAASLPLMAQARTAAYDPTPQMAPIKSQYAPGQLLILPRSHYLYFVTAPGEAVRYGGGRGQAGAFRFLGELDVGYLPVGVGQLVGDIRLHGHASFPPAAGGCRCGYPRRARWWR